MIHARDGEPNTIMFEFWSVSVANNMESKNTKGDYPPLMWRAPRYVLWLIRRKIWEGLVRVGFTSGAGAVLGHPLDQKVGFQIAEGSGQRVLVVCDFAAFPLSYDIVVFLATADNYCRRSGCQRMDVAFIAHEGDPLMNEAFKTNPVNHSVKYRAFIYNLAIEATRLYKSIGDVQFFTNRSNFITFLRNTKSTHKIFPEEYTPFRPGYLPSRKGVPYYGMRHLFENSETARESFSLCPPVGQLNLAETWIKRNSSGRKIITITLRETPHQPERNSNLNAWQALVDRYKNQNILFVILRDYFAIYDQSPIIGEHVIECPEAVHSMSFRAAIYEQADLNLFTGNGPAMLCLLNPKTHYIVFKMSTDSASARPEEIFFQHGLSFGKNMPGASKFQKLVWENDDASVLIRELGIMLDTI